MNQASSTEESAFVLSFLELRKAVGIIGTVLPFVLVIGRLVLEGLPLPASISGYYYTDMRNVLVGSMCAIGVFLFCYRLTPHDNRWSNVAGVFAVGVALVPTSPSTNPTPMEQNLGYVHTAFATGLFLLLAYFSYHQFPMLDPGRHLTPAKERRNVVYKACGVVIAACVLGALVNVAVGYPAGKESPVLFVFESVAVVAFGISWAIKGRLGRGAEDGTA